MYLCFVIQKSEHDLNVLNVPVFCLLANWFLKTNWRVRMSCTGARCVSMFTRKELNMKKILSRFCPFVSHFVDTWTSKYTQNSLDMKRNVPIDVWSVWDRSHSVSHMGFFNKHFNVDITIYKMCESIVKYIYCSYYWYINVLMGKERRRKLFI